jgi:RNase P/RNase MRP subunit p30
MKTDYVFPKDNEELFVDMAEKLGYKKLFLLYKYNKNFNVKKIEDKIKDLKKKSKVALFIGLVSNNKDLNKALKITRFVFIDAKNETQDNLRNIIEKKKPFLIYNLEYQQRDFIHHKNSGLNQVTSKFLQENKIAVSFSFSLILHTKNTHFILGRIMQNIRFARKFKFKTTIGSFANNPMNMRFSKDLSSLFVCLGMHQKKAEDSLEI